MSAAIAKIGFSGIKFSVGDVVVILPGVILMELPPGLVGTGGLAICTVACGSGLDDVAPAGTLAVSFLGEVLRGDGAIVDCGVGPAGFCRPVGGIGGVAGEAGAPGGLEGGAGGFGSPTPDAGSGGLGRVDPLGGTGGFGKPAPLGGAGGFGRLDPDGGTGGLGRVEPLGAIGAGLGGRFNMTVSRGLEDVA